MKPWPIVFLIVISTSLAQWQPSKLFKSFVDFIVQQRTAIFDTDDSPIDSEYD